MLNQVNDGMYRAARIMTLRHPNSLDVSVWDKKAKDRDGLDFVDELEEGGAGLMSPRDEAEYTHEIKGMAKMFPLGRLERASHADFGMLGFSGNEVFAYIEPLDEKHFTPEKHDKVVWHLSEDREINYEIGGKISPNYFPENRLSVYVLIPLEANRGFE